LQVADLEPGTITELTETGPESAEAGPRLPVLRLETLDLRSERLGSKADSSKQLGLGLAAANGKLMTPLEQFLKSWGERVEASGDGIDVGDHDRHDPH
jgi:hypothetical protein